MKDVIENIFGEYDYSIATDPQSGIAYLDYEWLAAFVLVLVFLLGFFALARIALKSCFGGK
ncbi:MAG: hypothetical protein MJ232_03100 [archaeon]|nr:hypothetical protein [archaeon]